MVIPVAFLATYAIIDAILAAADPTYGQLLIGAAKTVIAKAQESLAEANDAYSTTWNIGVMALPAIIGYVCNFLYFLLCGISFKRNKILWAFIILFIASIVISTVLTMFGLQTHYDIDDLAEAEALIRSVIGWSTTVSTVLAVGLAGGIFYRIKTLKH